MPLQRNPSGIIRSGMDRLRRSLRESFRRRSGSGSPSERNVGSNGSGSGDGLKPQLWSQDEATVRAGTCAFSVKYLGSVEVGESRGMQVCEEALKVLRASRRRPVKGVLYVSGDGIRVVDSESKGLVVDQTIEKVSFCAPDRNHEKGFAYICRDGTTRRWMCHGFHASKDSGERLSHAVGCAFAVCLERKQKRDRDAQQPSNGQHLPKSHGLSTSASSSQGAAAPPVSSANDPAPFQRQGSFRQAPLNERLQDPQNVKLTEKPPVRPAINPHAVARPVGNRHLFTRQGSLRMPQVPLKEACHVEQASVSHGNQDAFRRFNSLRLNQLPSNLERFEQTANVFAQNAIMEEELPGIPGTHGAAAGNASYYCAQSNSSYFSPPVSEMGSPPRSASFDAPMTNGRGEACEAASGGGASPFHRGPGGSSARLRGEEWLQTAAKQAKLLQLCHASPAATSQSQGVLPGAVGASHTPPTRTPTRVLDSRPPPNQPQTRTLADFDAKWNALAAQQNTAAEEEALAELAARNPFSKESSTVNI